MITVASIACNKCGDVIYSRAHHDYRSCTCKHVFIDGGFDYTRYGGEVMPKPLNLDGITKQQLYDDWNLRTDKFGKIRRTDIEDK